LGAYFPVLRDGLAAGKTPVQLDFAQGGRYDVQRVGPNKVHVELFEDFANVAIGLYAAAAGIPQTVTLFIANQYGAKNSDFGHAKRDPDYPDLRVQNVYDIKLGYQLYLSRSVRPTGASMPPTSNGNSP
jgi:hypothetical protein